MAHVDELAYAQTGPKHGDEPRDVQLASRICAEVRSVAACVRSRARGACVYSSASAPAVRARDRTGSEDEWHHGEAAALIVAHDYTRHCPMRDCGVTAHVRDAVLCGDPTNAKHVMMVERNGVCCDPRLDGDGRFAVAPRAAATRDSSILITA